MEKYGRAEQDTNDNIVQRMRISCRMNKTTDTNSEYVILTAFPLQEWLHESPSLLRYTNIALP
jgi:hypothetical protein